MIYAGIDAGSRTIKVVLLDWDSSQIVATGIADQEVEQEVLVRELFEDVLRKGGVGREQVRQVVATGYGRHLVRFADTTITEISCQACGVRHRHPQAQTVIDIGGQDSKLIRLGDDGRIRDFVMNDRCAAGTGRFLEVAAMRLGIELEALGKLAAKSVNPAAISSMCIVFAETEIIGLLASQMAREDIVAGVQNAIAVRVGAMAGGNIVSPVLFTGGVAMIPGMDIALTSVLDRPVAVADDPQMTGALGAAILATQQSSDSGLKTSNDPAS